jgi:surface carbohydrate biosynthesis protein
MAGERPGNVDVLIFIEHVARELDIACALKHLAAQRHGLEVAIASINWDLGRTLRRAAPRVVAIPYCYSALPEDPGLHQMLTAWPRAVYVNLAYEQVVQRINQRFNLPRDTFARTRVLHHVWGAFRADALVRCGVPEAHVICNGNPSFALYQAPYRAYFDSREAMAARYHLDAGKPWIFIPESYGEAFHSDRTIADFARRGQDAVAAREARAFAQASLRAVARWWQEAAEAGIAELIVRPRPMTPLASFHRACARALGEPLTARLHLIKDGTVREWILASDVVASNYSTTLIEAAMADKPLAMLMPLPLPEALAAEWYHLVPQITRASAFLACLTDGTLEGSWRELKRWAEDRLLGHGDPLVNLADLLAALARGERGDLACPAADQGWPDDASPSWGHRALSRLRLRWRQKVHERLHEQDRIRPADITVRVARWAAVLRGEAPVATANA